MSMCDIFSLSGAKLCTLVFSGVGSASVVAWYYRNEIAVELTHWFGSRGDDELRRQFQAQFVLGTYRSPKGHSHPQAAETRTNAAAAIRDFITGAGYEPYVISASSRESDCAGSHGHYILKDVVHARREDRVESKHIVMLVDVDYYLDMPALLKKGQPVLMYTFVPDALTGVVDNGAYRIVADEVEMQVSGGARYKHGLWAYEADWMKVHYWWGARVFSVEQKQVDPYHRVILLNPVARQWGPSGWWLSGERLARKHFGCGQGLNRLDSLDAAGKRWTSVGVDGHLSSVKIRTELFEAVATRFRAAKNPEISTIERYMRADDTEDAHIQAPVLFDVMSRSVDVSGAKFWALTACGEPQREVRSYQCFEAKGSLVTEDGRKFGRVVAPPLTNCEAVVPRDSYNNDLQCISGRVEKVRNEVVPHSRYNRFAAEFVRLLVPEPMVGNPWTTEEVEAVQNRPTQRSRTDRERGFVRFTNMLRVSSFMKKEPYAVVNDPRNISMVPTSHTLRLSAFTYPFKKQVLGGMKWYAPGKTPREIAERVHELAVGSEELVETDYGRFDGTISEFLREKVEKAAYMRWIAVKFRAELGGLLRAEHRAPGVTAHGVRYNAGFGRLSGSPLTTDGNTMINAFVSFCAGRLLGWSEKEAFERLGVFAGDDGLSAVVATALEAAAKELGLRLEAEVRPRGEPVRFLARVFVQPDLEMGSFQDPVRTIQKLHMSFAPQDVPDEVAVYNRARGYYDLDPEAPVVSDWCRLVMRSVSRKSLGEAEALEEKCRVDRPYYAAEGENGWPQPNRDAAEVLYAKELDMDVVELRQLRLRISGLLSYRGVEPWVQLSKSPRVVAVVDGDPCPLPAPASPSSDGGSLPRRKRPAKTRPRRRRADSGVPTSSSSA